TGRRADPVRPTGPARIDDDDSEGGERTREPAVGAHRSDRARGLDARPALQEDEVGLVTVRLSGDDASEHAEGVRHVHLRAPEVVEGGRECIIQDEKFHASTVLLLHVAYST